MEKKKGKEPVVATGDKRKLLLCAKSEVAAQYKHDERFPE